MNDSLSVRIIRVGFFGIPGFRGGLTHLVIDGKPFCGTIPTRNSEFQWCANEEIPDYVECKKCLKKMGIKK